MSYWVYLEDRAAKPWCSFGSLEEDACPEPCYQSVSVKTHEEGGTFCVGGTAFAEMNVTYNYGKFFYETLGSEGLRSLHGKKAKDVTCCLADALGVLGCDRDADYWKPTRGNAGHALKILLGWAKQNPEAMFRVS